MFEAYFDDSGTDSNSPLAIAACYVSSKRGWDAFVEEWNLARYEEDFDVFHMADFAAPRELGKKPFCDWGSDKKKRVYNRLAKIINENKRIGCGIAIPKDVFDRLVPPLPESLRAEFGTQHYTCAVKTILWEIVKWRHSLGITLPIRYIFDRMGQGRGEIIAIWDDVQRGHWKEKTLGMEPEGYAFENKAKFKPLQAADILAWQMNWHVRNVINAGKHDVDDAHPNFRILRLDQQMNLGFFTEENFLKTIEIKRRALQSLAAKA
jgi:Protein of unknown function (DUF3800)